MIFGRLINLDTGKSLVMSETAQKCLGYPIRAQKQPNEYPLLKLLKNRSNSNQFFIPKAPRANFVFTIGSGSMKLSESMKNLEKL